MKFYNIANHDKGEGKAVIQIMDQIGYNWWTDKGVEATNFINEVRELGELNEVFLEINSPGGNVHDGVSIANFIKSHNATWTACVIGQAASIATVIASACDEIEMGVGTNYLVHKPMSALSGFVNADECRAIAKNLDTIETSIIDFYLPRVEAKGKTKEELLALMEEDRYMSADEAMEWGFVDSKAADIQAVAFTASKVAAEVAALKAVIAHKDSELAAYRAKDSDDQLITINTSQELPEIFASLKASIDLDGYELIKALEVDAKYIAEACAKEDATCLIQPFIEQKLTNAQVDEQLKIVNEIQDICASASLDSQPILSNLQTPATMLRNAISETLALNDPEQDSSLPSGVDDPKPVVIDTTAIYENRNKQ